MTWRPIANSRGLRGRASWVVVVAGLVGCGTGSPTPAAEVQTDAADIAEAWPDAGWDARENVLGLAPPPDWCVADAPPDEVCYASKREPSSEAVALARAVAGSFLVRREPASLAWNWEEAVGMFAMTEVSRVVGDPRYREYVGAWLDHHIEGGYTILTSDTCAPALPALALLAATGEARYRTLVEDALHYLYEVAVRDEEGGINHLGTTDIAGVTLWVDSLFMFGMPVRGVRRRCTRP